MNLDVKENREQADRDQRELEKAFKTFTDSLTYHQYRKYNSVVDMTRIINGAGWLRKLDITKVTKNKKKIELFEAWRTLFYYKGY